ncbi:MAG TPA: hypothetical protein PLM16_02235 [Candidatus Woesebacteria bacterium]|nr:hypothetical protein [Candidatus Woesebacteria bacterium]
MFLLILVALVIFDNQVSSKIAFFGLLPTNLQPQINSEMSLSAPIIIETNMELKDARAQIVANFLAKYNSPLEPYDHYGQLLVEIADRYGLDFRFLPAVMMEESNLCKNIPEGSFNCLGFGIHARGTLGFSSYEAGFERAAKELKANYVEQGRIQVSTIARKYTASVDKWTNSVNQWMAEMEYDDRSMGIERKVDANVLEYVKDEDAN